MNNGSRQYKTERNNHNSETGNTDSLQMNDLAGPPAQHAHPADAVPASEIVEIVRGIMEMKAVPIYRGGAADAPGVGPPHQWSQA